MLKENENQKPQPLAFSIPEAARLAGLSTGSLRWHIFKKTGPKIIRIGRGKGRCLVRLIDLEVWLEEHTEGVEAGNE